MKSSKVEFNRLQERLPTLWKDIEAGAGVHTSVVVPSLSFRQDELTKITGAPFYEERLLFTLMRLRDPRARVVYLTSQPIHPHIVDYYLQLLVGVPARLARERLLLLCTYDASPRALTEKILERPRLIERIRQWVGDPTRAYLTCFMASPLERELAVELDIPLNGVDPDLLWIGTKTGSRRIFARAGIDYPAGSEDLHTEDEVFVALDRLAAERPTLKHAVVKLNESFSGTGNALLTIPSDLADDPAIRHGQWSEALAAMRWAAPGESWQSFRAKLEEMGGIVEEMLEAPVVHSPSVQMRINPLGELSTISTHDQVLGGEFGQMYHGCRFPAAQAYREQISADARKVGEILASEGVVSRFGVDFLAIPDERGGWKTPAIEINLRMGGTTPPFLALQFLTGGRIDDQGEFHTRTGVRKYYRATDSLQTPSYHGLLPEDLIEILTQSDLQFQPQTETGVLFHMIGALSQHGKVGVTCIGDSREQADDLFQRTIDALDAAVEDPEAALDEPIDADTVQME